MVLQEKKSLLALNNFLVKINILFISFFFLYACIRDRKKNLRIKKDSVCQLEALKKHENPNYISPKQIECEKKALQKKLGHESERLKKLVNKYQKEKRLKFKGSDSSKIVDMLLKSGGINSLTQMNYSH